MTTPMAAGPHPFVVHDPNTKDGGRRDILARFQEMQRRVPVVQILALVGLFLVGVTTLPQFASRSAIDAMLVLASFLGIAAAGQTIVILIGGIDLSVPSIISGANLITVALGGRNWPFYAIVALILSGSLLVGAVNGFVAHRYRVPPLIVTLATGSIVAGAVLAWTHGAVYGGVPKWFTHFVSPAGKVGPVPVPPIVVFWAGFTIVFSVVLHLTGLGRKLFATGANERAAKLALVRTERVWVSTFAASALCSGIVGIFLAAWSGTGDASIGDQYLFLTIAAVIVGGTSLIGAVGDYWHTVLGSLILTVLTTILVGHSFGASAQQILLGIVILVVVATYGRDRALRDRL